MSRGDAAWLAVVGVTVAVPEALIRNPWLAILPAIAVLIIRFCVDLSLSARRPGAAAG